MSTPAGQHTIREHNLTLVMGYIKAGPNRSRAQLAEATGLTRATVSGLVDELITNGLLVELEPDRGTRGRPGSPVALNPDGPAGIGIEVAVDYISVCIVDLSGNVRAYRAEPMDNRSLEPVAVLRRAAELANEIRDELEPLVVVGAALAVPGLVDAEGYLRRAPNLPHWQDVELAPVLSHALGLPVSVDNEANLAALAELRWGEPLGDFVRVSAEIGVGAGIVIDQKLYRGVRGRAGELGHVVVDPTGGLCSCGSNGCLEQVAGGQALLYAAGIIAQPRAPIGVDIAAGVEELMSRAEAYDRQALVALNDAGHALGVALAGTVNLLDIPTVVLGGIYADLAEWLLGPISLELVRRVLTPNTRPAELRFSAIGATASVRGAGRVVVEDLIARPYLASTVG